MQDMAMTVGAQDMAMATESDMSGTIDKGDMAGKVEHRDMTRTMDLEHALETLTVNNQAQWCTVTVTVPGSSPVSFTGASMPFMAAAGATINLQADPLPGYQPVQWTGVTTMNGDKATYVMTGSASQSVTAYCP
jgi:hypothetical protein